MRATTDNNLKYLGGALVIHALLAILLFGAALMPRHPIQPTLSLQAVMVDKATLAQLQKAAPKAPPAPEPEVKPEEPDPAEVKRQQDEQEAAQRKQEQREQQQKEQAVREQQVLLQKQADEKQKQQEQLRKAADEQKRQQLQQQQEAEKKRLADIQQKQREADAKKAAQADLNAQRVREAELAAQLAAEEGRQAAVSSGLLNQYVALIQQKVMRYWIKPPTAKAGLECEVKVTQAMGGTVLSVAIGRCNGDPAVRASIEAAVNAASPLPAPPDPRLFDRNLAFIFKPVD